MSMNSDQPAITDVFEGLEEFQTGTMSTGVSANGRDWWWRSCQIWLFSLTVDVLLLFFVAMLAGGRPHGRGGFGSSERIFLSATFATAGREGSGGEVDTTIPEVGTAWEPRTVSAPRPLLTLIPADPQSVFDVSPAEPLTTESLALETDTEIPSAARRRSQSERTTNAGASMTASQDTEVVASNSLNATARVTPELSRDQASSVVRSGDVPGQTRSGRGNKGVGGDANPGVDGTSGGSREGDRTEFFGIAARAQRFVYVVDASESMHEHRAMQTARQELWLSLQELSASVKFQVVFFNLKPYPITRRGERTQMLSATETNLRFAQQFLNGIQPDSGTDRFGALTSALSLDPDVVFLLTDSDAPELSAKELAGIRRLNWRKAVIHVVEFGKGVDLGQDNFLKAMARQHGGIHRYHDLMRARQ